MLVITLENSSTLHYHWRSFLDVFATNSVIVRVLGESKPNRSGVVSLIIGSIRQAARGISVTGESDMVFSNGALIGLCFEFLVRIFRRRRGAHVIFDVGLSLASENRFVARCLKLSNLIIRDAVTIQCFALSEVEFWKGIGVKRVDFIPVSIDSAKHVPVDGSEWEGEGYIFSGGRTARDYKTLCQSVAGIDVKVVLVAGSDPTTGRTGLEGLEVPSNVSVLRDLPLEQFNRLMRGSRLVVLPLLPVPHPVGQTVLITAMSFGKPIIATKVPGTVDYLRNMSNGILVEPRAPTELRSAIQRLMEDKYLRIALGSRAREEAISTYSGTSAARTLAEICISLKKQR